MQRLVPIQWRWSIRHNDRRSSKSAWFSAMKSLRDVADIEPDSVRPTVDAVLAGYREKFDSSAHLNCSTNHSFASGIVKRTFCQFDIESKVEACQGFDCSAWKTNTDLALQRSY